MFGNDLMMHKSEAAGPSLPVYHISFNRDMTPLDAKPDGIYINDHLSYVDLNAYQLLDENGNDNGATYQLLHAFDYAYQFNSTTGDNSGCLYDYQTNIQYRAKYQSGQGMVGVYVPEGIYSIRVKGDYNYSLECEYECWDSTGSSKGTQTADPIDLYDCVQWDNVISDGVNPITIETKHASSTTGDRGLLSGMRIMQTA